ncbi:MAG TPA: Lrp/AsnC family transcriptional regulator [bacterium]|nr:Lrp/AsnC family transcriptional regulator [bacterium]
MDILDRKILDAIQEEVPIVSRPFDYIARQVATSEPEVLKRIRKLKQEKIIRRVGGSFNSDKLGYFSTLVAARVPDEKLEKMVEKLNRYSGVTHNYLRGHYYNLWFTLTACSKQRLHELLEQMKQQTGIEELFPLPAVRKFKIMVNFKMNRGK